MTVEKRGKVWLAVAGLVIDQEGRWLVVKKRYGGLEGKWSLPAGFVKEGETLDQACVREVEEETGITTKVTGLLGLRTGVIRDDISDNMVIFLLEAAEAQMVRHQTKELYEAAFISPEELADDPQASVFLRYIQDLKLSPKSSHEGINPGDQFQYTSYRLFL